MKQLHVHAEKSRAIITGFLLVFIFLIAKEFIHTPLFLGGGIAVILFAVFFAKKTAHHFHGHHTHAGDSPLDIVGIIVLFAANILHPAVDGFSIVETFGIGGIAAGALFIGGVVLHEIFRQSALVAAFKTMGIRWGWVLVTALLGISFGVGAGFLGTEVFHEYEHSIDLVTLFAYTFIIAEFHFSNHEEPKKQSLWFVVLGMLIGTILSLISKTH